MAKKRKKKTTTVKIASVRSIQVDLNRRLATVQRLIKDLKTADVVTTSVKKLRGTPVQKARLLEGRLKAAINAVNGTCGDNTLGARFTLTKG